MMTAELEILLVEDSDEDAELTFRALKRGGTTRHVHRLPDGAAAVEYLLRGDTSGEDVPLPKVILLDLKLPKLGGLDVLSRIKSNGRTASVPVVVLSSSREPRDVSEAYRRGANSYVVKPVDAERFAECIERVAHYWTLWNERLPAPP